MLRATAALLFSTVASFSTARLASDQEDLQVKLRLPLESQVVQKNVQLDSEKDAIKREITDEILSRRASEADSTDSSPSPSWLRDGQLFTSPTSSLGLGHEDHLLSSPFRESEGDFGADQAGQRQHFKSSDITEISDISHLPKLISWPHHPKVFEAEHFQAELDSELTEVLVANFEVGSNGQKVKLSLETSATWTAIDSNFCEACPYPNYDTSYSESYQQVFSSVQKRDGANGYISRDTLKLNGYSYGTSLAVSDFEFLALSEQSYRTKKNTTGYLGLVRPSLRFNSGPLWVGDLAANGSIEADMFCFSFAPEGEGSKFFDLGGIDSSVLKDPSRIAWIPQVANLMFWFSVSGATAIRIGNQATTKAGLTAEYSFGQFSYPVFFDSGYKLISPPAGVGAEFLTRLLHKKSRYVRSDQKLVLVKCDDDFEDVNLRIEGLWFQVKKEDYLIKTSKEYNGFDCYLAFEYDASSTQKYWTMGQAFMSGYYVIHDNTDPLKARLGFTPFKDSHKDFVFSGDLPLQNINDVKDEQEDQTIVDPESPTPSPEQEEEWEEDVEVLPESEEGNEVRTETSNEIDLDKGLFYYNRPPMKSFFEKLWEMGLAGFGMLLLMPGFLIWAFFVIV